MYDIKHMNQFSIYESAKLQVSPSTLVSSTNKTDRHDIITEILLKVALNTIDNPKAKLQNKNNEINLKCRYPI